MGVFTSGHAFEALAIDVITTGISYIFDSI